MAAFISYLFIFLAALFSIPIAIFCFEVLAAIILPVRGRPLFSSQDFRPRVAVLMPAHNESSGLLPTIKDITAQLRADDRLLVVADNCSDDTAAVAGGAGAEVITRNDLQRIGKGYALDFGLRYLTADPPDIVIIIDADCRLADGAIDRLAEACAKAKRPVQALYLMVAPDQSPINYQIAEFTWRVKNWVRPLGLKALNLPCQLMGTGMAFPWEQIRSINLASGQIVEDLKLGLDLALAGSPPLFCPSAVVTSQFPLSAEGADSQRQRWEHGHIGMILKAAPRFLYLALARRNLDLLALTLDLMVPPLFLLGLLTAGMVLVAGLAWALGCSPAALMISLASLAALLASVFLSWLKYGRDILPPRALLSIGPFVLGKLRLYRRFLTKGSVTQWVRTDRDKSNSPK
jgi:cellulose synthase/poly-beta-1,6-N-acetylglucosamine synthase-like glycosyltransferase